MAGHWSPLAEGESSSRRVRFKLPDRAWTDARLP